MDLGISDKLKPILEEVTTLLISEILPLEQEYHREVVKAIAGLIPSARPKFSKVSRSRPKPRICGISFLTHFEGGHGLNTVEYAYIAEKLVVRTWPQKYLTVPRRILAIWKYWPATAVTSKKRSG